MEDNSQPGHANVGESATMSEPAGSPVSPVPAAAPSAPEPAAACDRQAVQPDAGPAAKDTSSVEAEWLGQIKRLHLRLDDQERLSRDRERIIDRLHEENQRLKQGELLAQMMPVYRDLMRLYDDLKKAAVEYSGKSDITTEAAATDWEFFATAVTDLLYRYGVEMLPVEPGSPFDPRCHRASLVRKTGEQDRDKTVARVLNVGFAADGKMLRAAGIEVFKYDPSLAAPATEAKEEGEAKNG